MMMAGLPVEHMSVSRAKCRGIVTRLLATVNRLVDSPQAKRLPPSTHYIPNSSGEGGKVIASGHP